MHVCSAPWSCSLSATCCPLPRHICLHHDVKCPEQPPTPTPDAQQLPEPCSWLCEPLELLRDNEPLSPFFFSKQITHSRLFYYSNSNKGEHSSQISKVNTHLHPQAHLGIQVTSHPLMLTPNQHSTLLEKVLREAFSRARAVGLRGACRSGPPRCISHKQQNICSLSPLHVSSSFLFGLPFSFIIKVIWLALGSQNILGRDRRFRRTNKTRL